MDEWTVEIRGQPVTFVVSERHYGDPRFRQVTGTFAGSGNSLVMLMASGPLDGWDQEALAEFLASIR